MDWSNAALSLLFDPMKKAWSQEVAETFRIPLDKLPETCSPTSLVGETSTALCNRLGLKSGIPVAAGSIDTNCAALGAGVVKEGQAIDSGGAASCLGVVTDQPHFDNRFLNRCHAVPYRWITVSQGPHSGIALEWFRDEFCQPEVAEAIRTRTDPFLLMDQKAEYAEPGSRGLIFLPYFMGECSPIWDPYATSVFFGITPNHSRGEMIRSILEGTAYNIRHNLEVLESIGIHVNEIRAVGGQSKSDLWLKIRAEITGKRMVTVIAKDSTPLGSAILGGVAAGVYSDPSEAASEICEIDRVVEPEPEKLKTYGDLFEVYLEAYEGLKKASRMRASVLS